MSAGTPQGPQGTGAAVAVLGATGRTGRLVVADLLARDRPVAVLVRDPAKLGDLADRVRVVTGDAADPTALAELLAGADVVISALGPSSRDSDIQTRTAAALLPTMAAAGVTRFVGVSGAGIDVPGDAKRLPDTVVSWLIRTTGGTMARDKVAEYQTYAASDVDWTLVRPPRLTEGAATGRVHHDAHRPGKPSISRADLAAFVVDVALNDRYVRQAPFVSS